MPAANTSVSRSLSGSRVQRLIAEAIPDAFCTVSSDARPNGRSIFIRRLRMWTSMTLESPSYAKSQTCSMRALRAEHLAGVAHEELEQRELLARELDREIVSPHLVAGRDRARDRPPCRIAGRGSAPRRISAADPREQLLERERLREVVVGTHVEAANPILDGVARREHQHGRPAAGLDGAVGTPRSRRPSAGTEHDIEDDRVVRVLPARTRSPLPRRRRRPPRTLAPRGPAGSSEPSSRSPPPPRCACAITFRLEPTPLE